jgi:hypothetical protein
MRKKLIIIGTIILVLALAVFFVAGYFLGNVPVASAILGTNKAKDLGVKISVDSAYQGLKDLKSPITAQEVEAIQKNPKLYTVVKTTLSQDQASSLLALSDIPDFPFRMTQIKFGPNGSVQSSGVLDIEKLQKTLKDLKVSGDVINQVMGYIQGAKFVNYYFDGTCSITNNRIASQVNSAKIGNISVPDDVLKNNRGTAANLVSSTLTANGYNIRKMTISEGKVDLDLDRPLGSVQNWLKFVQ